MLREICSTSHYVVMSSNESQGYKIKYINGLLSSTLYEANILQCQLHYLLLLELVLLLYLAQHSLLACLLHK